MLQWTMVHPKQAGSVVPMGGQVWHPNPQRLHLRAWLLKGLLSSGAELVRQTILNARALYTQLQYNRWKLCVKCCNDHGEDPVLCSVPMVVVFLQSLLDEGRSPVTLRVYSAAISAQHARNDMAWWGSTLLSLFSSGLCGFNPP